MPIEVQELNHTAIHVRDLDASMAFYGGVLGLKPIPRPAFQFPGAWYALGAQELHLIADANAPEAGRSHHFALRVPDTYAARKHLEEQGFKDFVSHGSRPDGVIQLFITDPDGYLVELTSL